MKDLSRCVARICVFPNKKFLKCRDCHNYIENVYVEYMKEVAIEAMRNGEIEVAQAVHKYIENDIKTVHNVIKEKEF